MSITIFEFNSPAEIVARLTVAALAGAIIGVNRDLHRKPAGLRVLALVAMGAAAVTVAGTIAAEPSDPHASVFRTVQGVLSGIGFLGAGIIMRGSSANDVHGLTTATALWVACIVGIIYGMGQWTLGSLCFVLTMAILVIGRPLEKFVNDRVARKKSESVSNHDAE